MSMFLGPIHYWVYGKVQLQDELTKRFAERAQREGWLADVDRYVVEEDRPLEELIVGGNIHGSLQSMIHGSEERFAQLVTTIVKDHPERLDVLDEEAYEFGREHQVQADANALDGWKQLRNVLQDGMPCDQVTMMTHKKPEYVAWEQLQDVHGGFWKEVGGDPENYARLRAQVAAGILSSSKLRLQENDSFFQLTQHA